MSGSVLALVGFAVKEEAEPFRKSHGHGSNVAIILTGMGRKNAEISFRSALAQWHPELVITGGFAGGLDPNLKIGAVVFEADDSFPSSTALLSAGARSVRFHCADHVVATAAAKSELWTSTQAHAVEMESSIIRSICREHGIPSATVRVVSDAADEDLPLDFNRLMTPDLRIHYPALACALLKSPGKIPELMRFQKRIRAASAKLAEALKQAIGAALNTSALS